jgi:hypothetical protein
MTNTLTSTEDLVRTVLDRAMAAWTANDADAFADCYADDASVVLEGGVFLHDKAEIRAFMGRDSPGGWVAPPASTTPRMSVSPATPPS